MKDNKNYDYTDEFSSMVHSARFINAAELSGLFFSAPKWITIWMKFRNVMVKPLGLKKERDLWNLTFVLTDMRWLSHSVLSVINAISKSRCLSFLHTVAIFSDSICTKSHNSLGKCYFAIIKPFHNLICKILLQRAKNNIEKSFYR